MTYSLADSRLSALSATHSAELGFTRNPELIDHADMVRVFGGSASRHRTTTLTCRVCGTTVRVCLDMMPRTILCDACMLSPAMLAGEAALVGVAHGSPGPGARLVVDADDTRLSDPVLQRLVSDIEPMISSDRCWPDEEPTQPHGTCDTLPPPEDEEYEDDERTLPETDARAALERARNEPVDPDAVEDPDD